MYVKLNTSDPDQYELENKSKIPTANSELPNVGTTEKEKSQNGHVDQNGDTKSSGDMGSEEKQLEHIPYPKSVFFIISNEFCERFSYYGMRTVLSLYLRDILLFSEGDSKIIYHVFTMFAYFFPLFGAIISDSWLGKFRTILYVSMIYASGNVLLALASATSFGIPQIPFSLLALFLIAVGTGGIKPCVSAFGGDQFVLPQQELQLAAFFSVFYFSINAGSLISTFLTPVLREDVHCFGENTCYPLAFAVPGILMIVSVLIFFFGMPLYKIKKPEGNVVVKVVKCIWYGARKNMKSKNKPEHWLDHSEEKFGKKLVEDIKMTLKVLVIYIPLPIFYTLYDQQGSGWTFQAARMDGSIGFYTILPDQMQVINPLLILAFIPLFTYGVYPLLAKINILKTPLQRMACGGFLTALAFGISAVISFTLEATYPELPSAGNAQIRMYNPYECTATLNMSPYHLEVGPMGYKHFTIDKIHGNKVFDYTVTHCSLSTINKTGSVTVNEKKGYVYYMSESGFLTLEDNIDKPEDGLPKIRTLVSNPNVNYNLTYYDGKDAELRITSFNNSFQSINPGTYKLGGHELSFYLGGVYTVLVSLSKSGDAIESVKNYEITEPNSVHILWLLPQYIIITAGEILFSITGLEFSYSQAPVTMKSVMQAAFLMTSAIGNLIIVIIESAKIFDKQSYDFLLYAGLMVLDMVLFAFMAARYKYIDANNEDDNEGESNFKPEKRLSNQSFSQNDNNS